jgi:peptidoglycan/LPS O-acetylase OafA/YrhL
VLPWYLIWLLPFAALARTRRLRVAALLLGVYLFLGWMPYASTFWHDIGFNPSTTITGRADARYLHTLLN